MKPLNPYFSNFSRIITLIALTQFHSTFSGSKKNKFIKPVPSDVIGKIITANNPFGISFTGFITFNTKLGLPTQTSLSYFPAQEEIYSWTKEDNDYICNHKIPFVIADSAASDLYKNLENQRSIVQNAMKKSLKETTYIVGPEKNVMAILLYLKAEHNFSIKSTITRVLQAKNAQAVIQNIPAMLDESDPESESTEILPSATYCLSCKRTGNLTMTCMKCSYGHYCSRACLNADYTHDDICANFNNFIKTLKKKSSKQKNLIDPKTQPISPAHIQQTSSYNSSRLGINSELPGKTFNDDPKKLESHIAIPGDDPKKLESHIAIPGKVTQTDIQNFNDFLNELMESFFGVNKNNKTLSI